MCLTNGLFWMAHLEFAGKIPCGILEMVGKLIPTGKSKPVSL